MNTYDEKNLPLVSIIITCYNEHEYVAECLDSVLAQTYKNYEVIIVDDGSGDNSLEIINKYKKVINKFTIISQENQGVSAARNNGLKKAKGSLIFVLDADDMITRQAIEKMVEAMQRTNGKTIIYGNTKMFGQRNEIFQLKKPTIFNMTRGNQVPVSALYAKQNFIEFGGYDENMKQGLEDWDFWLKMISNGLHFKKIDDIILLYRIREGSATTQISPEIKNKIKLYIRRKHRNLFVMMAIPKLLFKISQMFYRKKIKNDGTIIIKILGMTVKKFRAL